MKIAQFGQMLLTHRLKISFSRINTILLILVFISYIQDDQFSQHKSSRENLDVFNIVICQKAVKLLYHYVEETARVKRAIWYQSTNNGIDFLH